MPVLQHTHNHIRREVGVLYADSNDKKTMNYYYYYRSIGVASLEGVVFNVLCRRQ